MDAPRTHLKENDSVPFVTNHWRRTGRLLAMAAGAVTLLSAAPASAATITDAKLVRVAAANALGCTADNALSKPLTRFGDFADYALAPGGNFESGAAGWLLTGDAKVVAGNEPAYVGAATDRSSLALPFGSTATSPTMCIDGTYPHLQGVRSEHGRTQLDAQGRGPVPGWQGQGRRLGLGHHRREHHGLAALEAAEHQCDVQHRGRRRGGARRLPLHPVGLQAANWQIDDVYVDPYARH